MTWLPLLGTLLGAVIALGSALLVEGRRERREDRIERRKAKQEVYARYLAAHAEMRTQLRVLSVASGLTDEERGYRAFTAYAACYAPRYELAVLAPEPVLSLARDFDRCARDLRDLIIEGANVQTHGGEHMRKYLDALQLVHMAMREDLNANVEG
ncbi:hypothetical protein SSP24_06250 [Streptomyces spinoverrucosus]|uniref:Uncharacterized protein n=1 Tax=Streptomyces spinoverrucosus TaxID=284043 RepID=A0A4Y3VAX7_9ACTN|nr:hypothetical protein [Streptomyces spinoverrucosus]GEC02970.1 hypothetical protein SSP24_06250 [Streptomyces spinoverrucosus]GHB39198.1 hypothetical protein GCM10010397_06340 [Streptomyces spinoverrucosus]